MPASWRPIETAPRDGTLVLLASRQADIDVGTWSAAAEDWLTVCCEVVIDAPTHWLPLPPLPEEEKD